MVTGISVSGFRSFGVAPPADDVDAWLLKLGYSRSIVGSSVQGRDLVAYELPAASNTESPMATVLFLSLVHGNEPMGLISLLATVDVLSKNKPLATCIVLFPFVNIDAYTLNTEASFQDLRTNLQTNCSNKICDGVDLNRNFANDWYAQQNQTKLSIFDGYFFGGSFQPFSEPESRAVKEVVETYNITHAMSFHSMSRSTRPRLLIHPFASERPMKEMARRRERQYRSWSRAMNTGDQYRTGNALEAIEYSALGASIDWMDSLGIFAFVLEAVPPCPSRLCGDKVRAVHQEGHLNSQTAHHFALLASGEALTSGEAPVNDEPIGNASLSGMFMIMVMGCVLALVVPRLLRRKKLTKREENQSQSAAEVELQPLTDSTDETTRPSQQNILEKVV